MPVWLVTGATGFLGRHVLAAAAGVPGAEVVTLGRRAPRGWPGTRFIAADLHDADGLTRALDDARPEVLVHAAGKTPPGDPDLYYRGNTLATVHLLDALRSTGRPARVVLIGSAAELGPVSAERLPAGEELPARPVGAYGLSKWLAACAGLAAGPPLAVVVGRVFNPIGPGLPESQAFGRFAARLAEEGRDVLEVGGLDDRRDFVDVRDVAAALIALAERGRAGQVYHIGSGRSRSVREGLEHLIRRCGKDVTLRVDPDRSPGPGPGDSRADVRKITAEVGWRPAIPWEQSLDDLWDEAAGRAGLALTD